MLKSRRSTTPTRDKFSPGKGGTKTSGAMQERKSSSGSLRSSGAGSSPEKLQAEGPHWSDLAREVLLVTAQSEAPPPPSARFSGWLEGGADCGAFPHFGAAPAESAGVVVLAPPGGGGSGGGTGDASSSLAARPPAPGDVLLEVAAQKVAGYTRADVGAWLAHCLAQGMPVAVKIVLKGRSNSRLRLVMVLRVALRIKKICKRLLKN